ncbi:hypothetical protein Tco_0127378 [Tanacetum coccineum]
MRRVNASTFWRRHGWDISSSSSSRYLFLDFQWRQFSRDPFSVRLFSPYFGTLVSKGGGGGLVVFVPGTVWGGVVKVARCRPSALVIVVVVWVVPRGGPIAVKTRSLWRNWCLPEACLEICLEAWSLCFFACGVRWVKFPCFVILDFGSVLSVGSPRLGPIVDPIKLDDL